MQKRKFGYFTKAFYLPVGPSTFLMSCWGIHFVQNCIVPKSYLSSVISIILQSYINYNVCIIDQRQIYRIASKCSSFILLFNKSKNVKLTSILNVKKNVFTLPFESFIVLVVINSFQANHFIRLLFDFVAIAYLL